MKILLLRPEYDKHHRPSGFPIGLGYLAAFVERAGHSVTAMDLALYSDWEEQLAHTLAAGEFHLAGISCMSVQYVGARRTAAWIKEHHPQLSLVMGGAHPSITPAETLLDNPVEFVIRGEGELPLLDLIAALENRRPLSEVGSLSYKQNGCVYHNPAHSDTPSLDDLPFPAYHLFPMEQYFQMEIPGFPTRKANPIQIFTSRGCPYHCIYCHNLFGKVFRPRSPENVLAEMRLLYDTYGCREFLIYDDNFTMELDRAKRVCQLIIGSGMTIGLQFPNGIRADRVDEELLELLMAAGAHSATIGIESGSPRIQKMIRKNLSLDKVAYFLQMARRRKLITLGSFIIGFPGETAADIWQTIRFARRSKLDYAFFGFATPYPATELHRMVLSAGLKMFLVHDAMDVTTPHIETTEMSLPRLKFFYILAYLLFYTHPRRIFLFLTRLFEPGVFRKYWGGLKKYLFPLIHDKKSA